MTAPRVGVWMEGSHHDFEPARERLVANLVADGFDAQSVSFADALDAPLDALILGGLVYSGTEGDTPDPARYERLEKRLSITPTMAMHCVLGSWDDEPRFTQLFDGRWDWPTSRHSPYEEFPVTVKPHPITEGMSDFATTDELYYALTPPRACEVFLEARYDGRSWPLAWAKPGYVYLGLGHDAAALDHAPVRTLITRSLRYLLP